LGRRKVVLGEDRVEPLGLLAAYRLDQRARFALHGRGRAGRQAGVLEEKLDGARLVGQVALGDRVARRDQRRLAGTEDPLARYRDRHGLSVASSVPGGAAASWSGRAAARPGLADRA